MKVIFLEEVTGVASMGDTKEVADGYARNYLLPRKLAVRVGSAETNMIEAKLKKKARLQAETEAELAELGKMLEGKEVVIKAKAGAEEKLYGSITTADIAEELAKGGINVDKRKIELAEPIRQIGSFEVTIKLTKDIAPKIKLTVTGEEAAPAKETAKEEK